MTVRRSTAARKLVPIHPAIWDKKRLKNILRQFSGRPVLVVGDLGVDRYTMGSVERISPEAPVPIVLVEKESLKLGLAANVADNVQALGGVPFLTGVVGKDRGAEDFKALLIRSRISPAHLVADRSRRTVLKERIVAERQQMLRIDYENLHDIDDSIQAQLLKKIRILLPKVSAVILEDYAKGMVLPDLAKRIFSMAADAGKIVAVDPNSKSPVALYRGASVLTPNTKEAEALTGISIRDDRSLLAAGNHLLTETRAEHIVITRGKDGMAIFSRGNSECRIIPTYAKEVFDVSGAGDTVISVLALALSVGASVEDAAILGNLAAGVEVGKLGTATVRPEEILVALEFFSTMSND